MNVPILVLTGVLSAAAGAVGTILIQRLLPEPKPGDGWTVRWIDDTGTEKRVDFGENERAALERAIELGKRFGAVVEIVEVRQGLIIRLQKAGESPKELVNL